MMIRTDEPAPLFDLLRRSPGISTEDHRTALARAITLVESTQPDDQRTAKDLIERCLPFAGTSVRIGITGPPGVGKSTLIDILGLHLIKAGHRVAVLAIDPSGVRGGGSILGDKTRMEQLAAEPDAYIRPTPARGALGGVARHTREAMILCEAAGYDRLLVETVGIGQNEVTVDRLVDITVLLMLAGAGDELQGIKRGIMEAADLIAITKADGDNRGRSEQARLDLRGAIALLPSRDGGRRAQVLLCSAVEQIGIEELAASIETLAEEDRRSGWFDQRRKAQDRDWMHQVIEDGLLERFRRDPRVASELPLLEAAVMEGRISPFSAAADLLDRLGR